MISPITMFCLLFCHYIGDFVFQSDKMALGKSKGWKTLGKHCGIYSLCFFAWGWQTVLILFMTHFVIDAVTSRLNAHFWANNERRNFFLTIGFDQLVHLVILVLVAPWVY
jgi:hypothetical protein